MYLLRISYLICLIASLISLSSCAILSETGSRTAAPKADDWDKVPKTYIDGLKSARKGDSKTAISLLKLTTESHPDFSPAYINLGLQQLRLKRLDEAELSLKKSVELKPDSEVAYQHLGVLYRLKGEFSKAQSMYEKALDLNSDYAEAHLNLGILLDMYLYDFEEALAHYEAYQSLLGNKDKDVAKWIIDIKRRIAKNKQS